MRINLKKVKIRSSIFLTQWCFHLNSRKKTFSLDFCLFRDIVLLRTVRAATSTHGDTYYDKRGKTDGAQVAFPGTAGDHDADTSILCTVYIHAIVARMTNPIIPSMIIVIWIAHAPPSNILLIVEQCFITA